MKVRLDGFVAIAGKGKETVAYLQIPPIVLKELGWKLGDPIEMDVDFYGNLVLRKAK